MRQETPGLPEPRADTVSTNAFLIAEWIVRLAMFVVVILRKRSAAAALAWLVVVAFVPFVGALAYFMFGEARLGIRRSLHYQRMEEALGRSPELLEQFRDVAQPELGEPHRTLARLSANTGGSEPLAGNDVELHADTGALFRAVVDDIDRAERHCHLLFYIAHDDEVGRQVGEALVRARRRGVTCRMLLDAAGSRVFFRARLCRELREAGVEVVPLMPVSFLRASAPRIDLRNHRKLIVVDGRVAYTGSHNLSTPTYRGKERYGDWIDASVRVRGPVVHELQEVFLHDWVYSTGRRPDEEDVFPLYEHGERDVVAAVMATGPTTPEAPLMDVVVQTLHMAQSRVVLTTPYFVPEDGLLSAMRSAARRGVEVILVVPERSDQWIVQAAGRAHYGHLLRNNVMIYEYPGALLHAKTLTMDRQFAMMGSANLDVRSFQLNFELSLLVYDTDFASELHFLQTEYISRCHALDLERWRRRGPATILGDNVAKLVTPIL